MNYNPGLYDDHSVCRRLQARAKDDAWGAKTSAKQSNLPFTGGTSKYVFEFGNVWPWHVLL